MSDIVKEIPYRSVGEWSFETDTVYAEPFVDLVLDATFTAPSGRALSMPGFYDGGGLWRVRFSPDEPGSWRYRITTRPADAELETEGGFTVTEAETSGFLKSTPGRAWGFETESGDPVFLMGDTVYNLFGAAYCGMDVTSFLQRRAEQGFSFLRVRMQVSPYHPPEGYSDWQTRSTWPWGGSEQSPRFDRFNLEYFECVDEVVQAAAELGIGFEMIMEAWGFEYPFNNRAVFLPEWEEVWMRYLIARYDAYASVYFWTLMNEYEFYPDGNARHTGLEDRWAIRVARWLKALSPHGHVIAVHNAPQMPPFAERFRLDPGAVDAVMFQAWGTIGKEDAWMTAGIEETIRKSFAGWGGSVVFVEYGYERNPDLALTFPPFTYLDAAHNRRGAWRGAFCGVGVCTGFENSWGPVMDLEHDQEGVLYFQHLHRFVTDVVPFHQLHPAQELLADREPPYAWGHTPLVLASAARDLVAIYFPAGGEATLALPGSAYTAQCYDPRTGAIQAGRLAETPAGWEVGVPETVDAEARPLDWVLTLAASTLG
jgi:hypothetical protein